MSLIKTCGVDRVFKLEQGWPDASASSTKVYFVRPSLANAKIIADHLQMSSNIQKGTDLVKFCFTPISFFVNMVSRQRFIFEPTPSKNECLKLHLMTHT